MRHEAWTTPKEGALLFITVDSAWDVNFVNGPPKLADLVGGAAVRPPDRGRYRRTSAGRTRRAPRRDDQRAGERDSPAGIRACTPDPRDQRRGGEHDRRLPDLDADVEGEEREPERLRRQSELAQHAREAEPVDEPEQEREPCARGRECPPRGERAQVVDPDEHDLTARSRARSRAPAA
jgi:hypothetical protein